MKKILVIDSIYEKHFNDLSIEKKILNDFNLTLLHIKSLIDIPINLISQVDGVILWGCASCIDMNKQIIDRIKN